MSRLGRSFPQQSSSRGGVYTRLVHPLTLYVTKTHTGNLAKLTTNPNTTATTTHAVGRGASGSWLYLDLGVNGNTSAAFTVITPAPDGRSAVWLSSNLYGRQLLPGKWTATIHLRFNESTTTVVGTLYMRVWRKNASSFNLVGLITKTITFGFTGKSITITGTLPGATFATGTQLYIDFLIHGGVDTSSNTRIRTNVGSTNLSIVTPGYGFLPSTKTKTVTPQPASVTVSAHAPTLTESADAHPGVATVGVSALGKTTGSISPLVLYVTPTRTGTTATLSTSSGTGATATWQARANLPGSVTRWWQAGLGATMVGSTTIFTSETAVPHQRRGAIWNSTALNGNAIAAGKWTFTFTMRSTGIVTLEGVWIRIYRLNGTTYNLIANLPAAAHPNLTTTLGTYVVTGTVPRVTFTPGTKLYFELVCQGGGSPTDVFVPEGSDNFAVVTPGIAVGVSSTIINLDKAPSDAVVTVSAEPPQGTVNAVPSVVTVLGIEPSVSTVATAGVATVSVRSFSSSSMVAPVVGHGIVGVTAFGPAIAETHLLGVSTVGVVAEPVVRTNGVAAGLSSVHISAPTATGEPVPVVAVADVGVTAVEPQIAEIASEGKATAAVSAPPPTPTTIVVAGCASVTVSAPTANAGPERTIAHAGCAVVSVQAKPIGATLSLSVGAVVEVSVPRVTCMTNANAGGSIITAIVGDAIASTRFSGGIAAVGVSAPHTPGVPSWRTPPGSVLVTAYKPVQTHVAMPHASVVGVIPHGKSTVRPFVHASTITVTSFSLHGRLGPQPKCALISVHAPAPPVLVNYAHAFSVYTLGRGTYVTVDMGRGTYVRIQLSRQESISTNGN
jgi:hypothetical protein